MIATALIGNVIGVNQGWREPPKKEEHCCYREHQGPSPFSRTGIIVWFSSSSAEMLVAGLGPWPCPRGGEDDHITSLRRLKE